MKKYFLLLLVTSVIFLSCKKEKKEEISTPTDESGTSTIYYMKTQVDGVQENMVDGENGYSGSDGSSTNFSSGNSYETNSYDFSFHNSSTGVRRLEISINSIMCWVSEKDSSFTYYLKTGNDTLMNRSSAYYQLFYQAQDGKVFKVNPAQGKIPMVIDEVVDLGRIKTSDGTYKRVATLKGRIDNARLYQFSTGAFQSNYVDFTNLNFLIRFESREEL